MANITVKAPYLLKQVGNLNTQKAPLSDGGNTFIAGSFVQVNSSNQLQAVPTSSGTALTTQVYGWSGDANVASGSIPPAAFFGQNHYPFDVRGATFEINVSVKAGTIGGGNTTNANVTVGTAYGIVKLSSGIQCLSQDETTNTVLEVVGLGSNASTDYNARVQVRVLDTSIQA